MCMNSRVVRQLTHLQWTTMGLSPEFICHFCTWPIRSISPTPLSGTPSSGQPTYWYCLTGIEDWSYSDDNKLRVA